MSLPQSALPFSSHLSPMHRLYLYHLHILHYHFALCTFITHTHTHTHKHKTTILHYPSSQAQEHYIYIFFALSTLAAQDHFALFTCLLDTDSVKIIALCTIGSDPFMYLETHYVLPMC